MSSEKPLGYLLCQSRRVYKNIVTSRFKQNAIDLSLDEYIILIRIHLHSDDTQQKLADHLQKDKSIILRQINGLLDKNYLIRTVDKEDKRKKILILTTEGKEILDHSKEIAKQISEELLQGISQEDRNVFVRVFEIIRANAGIEDDHCNCK